jgi:hypothetical protein
MEAIPAPGFNEPGLRLPRPFHEHENIQEHAIQDAEEEISYTEIFKVKKPTPVKVQQSAPDSRLQEPEFASEP